MLQAGSRAAGDGVITDRMRVRAYMKLHGFETLDDFSPEVTLLSCPLSDEISGMECQEMWENICAFDPEAENMTVEE